jgi:hypothetical protein
MKNQGDAFTPTGNSSSFGQKRRANAKSGRKRALLFVGTAGLMASAVTTHAALLSENFDDVSGTTPRTIANILAGNPSQLPAGSGWLATSLNAADVNIRSGNDTINTSTGSAGFDNFFGTSASNKFLVLGDQSGNTTGTPNGGLLGQFFVYYAPINVGPGSKALSVSFDWAFDGTDTNTTALQQDFFAAGLIGGSGLSLSNLVSGGPTSWFSQLLVNKTSPGGFSTGTVDTALAAVPAGNYLLAFVQYEAPNSTATNSAVGIDNITISAVPVPAAVWLLGSAMTGFGLLGRRKTV